MRINCHVYMHNNFNYIDPEEIQEAIKWWLGMDTSSESRCAMCPHNMLDPLGHHAVTCKFCGAVVSRHNQLRDTFVQACRIAGVSASIEAGSGLGHEHLHTTLIDLSWTKN